MIVHPDGSRCEGSGGERMTTNNRMEMMAVIEGLRSLADANTVTVVTDSAYVERPFTEGWIAGWKRRGWKRSGRKGQPAELKNAELWRDLYAETQRCDITWRRVKGHSGEPLNERCDQFAVAGTLANGGDPRKMIELGGQRSPSRRPRLSDNRPHPVQTLQAENLTPEERERYGFADLANEQPDIWWWIYARPRSRCERCSEQLAATSIAAWCHERRLMYCVACVTATGTEPAPSKRCAGP